ncbi:MAG: Crp/Fnr family transcriptional regulator [Rhodospirillales bacterium]|nr:Crp/Fnr family transcriptional regulator [Acetobacter sp.]
MIAQAGEVPANMLLSRLPTADWAELSPKLRTTRLEAGQVIHEAGSSIETVYFVEDGMLSLVVPLSDGTRPEVGVIGHEGISALPLLAGISTAFLECLVQMSGYALCMGAADFREQYARPGAFRELLLRSNENFRSQISQTAACNARHPINHRLVRWLLMANARSESKTMRLHQEFLAAMLGCSRPAVSVALEVLQRGGLIHLDDPEITVVDREKLEASGCKCFRAIRDRMDAIFREPLQATAARSM